MLGISTKRFNNKNRRCQVKKVYLEPLETSGDNHKPIHKMSLRRFLVEVVFIGVFGRPMHTKILMVRF